MYECLQYRAANLFPVPAARHVLVIKHGSYSESMRNFVLLPLSSPVQACKIVLIEGLIRFLISE